MYNIILPEISAHHLLYGRPFFSLPSLHREYYRTLSYILFSYLQFIFQYFRFVNMQTHNFIYTFQYLVHIIYIHAYIHTCKFHNIYDNKLKLMQLVILTICFLQCICIQKNVLICYLLFVIISKKSWNLSTNNFVLHR